MREKKRKGKKERSDYVNNNIKKHVKYVIFI